MADEYNVLPIARVISSGADDTGAQLGIRVTDTRRTDCVIMIPHAMEAHFLFQLQAAAETATERRSQRGEGPMPTSMPINLKQFQTFIGSDGNKNVIILRLRLGNGMKLDIPLDAKTNEALIGTLKKAGQTLRTAGPAPKAN